MSLIGIYSFARTLNDVRSTVELGSVTTCPETVQGHSVSILKVLRDHGITETRSGKAGILGEAAKLNGTGSRAFTLIDGVRNAFFTDICLISSIVDDHCMILICIIHPLLQLCLGDRGTGRIIREAEIDQIRYFRRKLGCIPVCCRTGHVDHIAPETCCLVIGSRTSCHNICIYINGINRIAYCDPCILCKDLLDICGIALGAVGHKDLICSDVRTQGTEHLLSDGGPKEIISQIRGIPTEGSTIRHLIRCLVDRFDHCRAEGLCHIPDTEPDDLLIRIGFREGSHLLCYSRK